MSRGLTWSASDCWASACAWRSSVVVMVRPPRSSSRRRSSRVAAEGLVVEDRLQHEVAEERDAGVVAAVALALRHPQLQAGRLGSGDVGLARQPDLRHPGEDHVAAGQCPVGVAGRVEGGRLLHDAREQRRLRKREVPGVGAEVALGGGLDAVRAGAEVGDVQVALEDLLLAVLLLQRHRVAQLAQLAGVRLGDRGLLGLGPLLRVGDVGRRLEQHVLDVLLGQRRAALDVLAGLVVDERAHGAAQVDAAVVVEAGVLDGDDRLAHAPERRPTAGRRSGSRRRTSRSATRRRPGCGCAQEAAGSAARPAGTRSRWRCRGPRARGRRARAARDRRPAGRTARSLRGTAAAARRSRRRRSGARRSALAALSWGPRIRARGSRPAPAVVQDVGPEKIVRTD